ncbi:hypothetical protein AB0C34_20660 [Nocardia sp. NPDC049220]|uniref:hypothetical protein n=1 Tax=Nocardia sp. NPDC049220 TaxID=3155273 RepID=UPI0033E54826
MSSLVRGKLRPLPLPMPELPLLPGGREEMSPYASLALRPRREVLQPPRDVDERAFYRWILGHHIAFGVWRMLIDLFEKVIDKGLSADYLVQASAWYDRYSATQVYAGSCSPSTYATVIRPRMVACNPAFSGMWARDHERVLTLLGALDIPAGCVLEEALKRHRLIHMDLAKFLVPAGKSLLKQAGRFSHDPITDSERDQFDGFFMIARGPVPVGEFQAQMLRRIAAARCDLLTYPINSTELSVVQNLLPADVPTCLRDIAIDLIKLEPPCTSINASG